LDIFGTVDQLEMYKKHFEKMKKQGVRVLLFSMIRSKDEVEKLFSWVRVKDYYPVEEIVEKPPNNSPLICMLLPGLMDAHRALRRDEVLFVGRHIEPDDKILCKTQQVEGNTGLNKKQLEEIEGIVMPACRD